MMMNMSLWAYFKIILDYKDIISMKNNVIYIAIICLLHNI